MKLFAVGVSHKTAPPEVREQLAVQATELVDVREPPKGGTFTWAFGHAQKGPIGG